MYFHVPGNSTSVENDEWGEVCVNHPDRRAVTRICVEADSFGAEYANYCQECVDNREQARQEVEADPSQWETCRCGRSQPELRAFRDPEEGSHGPVYHKCDACYQRIMDNFCSDYEDEDDYWD